MKKAIALLTVLLLLFALLTTALSACAPKEEPVTEEPVTEEPVTSSLLEDVVFSGEYSLKAYSYEKVSEFSDAVANLTASFIYPDILSISSPKNSILIALSDVLPAGKTSSTSPLTLNLLRIKFISLRSYCISTSLFIISSRLRS